MVPKNFKRVIEKIVRANITGNWFLSGSVGRELAGMPIDWKPKDIDIASDEKTVEKFRRAFRQQGERIEDFVLFNIAGVRVEIYLKPRGYKFFKRIKRKNGINILSLQDQLERYEYAGSPKKAIAIKQFLETQKKA
jgi:hypothetical protein